MNKFRKTTFDNLTSSGRSELMRKIKSKDTKPEMLLRRSLYRDGLRYRKHRKDLPGKPDISIEKYRVVIDVRGCFWHGHDCHLFKWPSTREEFWRTKILSNRENDQRVLKALKKKGWRVLVVWECAIKGKKRLDSKEVIKKISTWLKSTNILKEIKGRSCGSF